MEKNRYKMGSGIKEVHFASFVNEKTFDGDTSLDFSTTHAKENLKIRPEYSCMKGKKVTYLKKLFKFEGLSTCKKIFKFALLIFLGWVLIPIAYYKDYKWVVKN